MNGFVEYEFIKGLKLKVSGGYTYDARSNDTFNNSKTRYGSPISTDKVNAQVVRQQRLTWLNENVLTYQVNINKKHFFNSLLLCRIPTMNTILSRPPISPMNLWAWPA